MTTSFGQLDRLLAGRYSIDRELGRGGMAVVYLGRDVKYDREVAIKVFLPELSSAVGAERFLKEISTTASLQHPNLLPLLDSGDADGMLYYVMPRITGESLRVMLERQPIVPIEEVCRLAQGIAAGLDYAHSLGVVHRDVKPENILMHHAQPLLADFGIALAISSASDRLTVTGLSLGTPQYMSPEQATGDRNVDHRTDVYALGAIVYEMLAGEPPFAGPTPRAVIARALTERPRPIRTIRDAVSLAMESAVLKALARDPTDRYVTAGAFAADLVAGSHAPRRSEGVRERPPGPTRGGAREKR